MAKPDLDGGWFKFSYELLAALMVAQIPKEARIVLFEVFAQIYGKVKSRTAKLSPTDIARRTGLAKANVARGIAFLLKNGVLRREGLDAYRFAKDYESWGSEGVPLMSPRLAGYVAFAPDLANPSGTRREPNSAPDRAEKMVIEIDNPSEDTGEFETEASVDALSKNERGVIEMDNALPYRVRERVVVVEEGGGDPDERVSDSITIPLPTGTDPKTGEPLIWSLRPFKPDPAELARVKSLIDAIDPMLYLGQKVENLKSAYPLAWIEKAFLRGAGQADHSHIAGFANTLLIAAWRRGYWIDPEDYAPAARSNRPETVRPPKLNAAQENNRRMRHAFDDPKPDPKERP